MKVFHQPYSEIKKMPLKDIEFCLALNNALTQYENQLMEKEKNKLRKR